MFIVNEMKTSTCVMCARETECLHVEGQTHPIHGWVCLPDFKKLVRIAAAATGQADAASTSATRQAKPRD
jgi:hypothetical protein